MNGAIWRRDWASMAQRGFTCVLVGESTATGPWCPGDQHRLLPMVTRFQTRRRVCPDTKRLMKALRAACCWCSMAQAGHRVQPSVRVKGLPREGFTGGHYAAIISTFRYHPYWWAPGYFQSFGLTDNALTDDLCHQSVKMWAGDITRRVTGAKGKCFLNHLSILFLLFLRLF